MPNKSLQRTVLHAVGEFHSYYVMTKCQGQERQIVFVCIVVLYWGQVFAGC